MKKIFKYTLEGIKQQIIFIESPANILSVEEQRDNIVLYALVDTDGEIIPIDILIIATGQPIYVDIDDYSFLGTVKMFGGSEMHHIFYRRPSDIESEKKKKAELEKNEDKETVRVIDDIFTGKNKKLLMIA